MSIFCPIMRWLSSCNWIVCLGQGDWCGWWPLPPPPLQIRYSGEVSNCFFSQLHSLMATGKPVLEWSQYHSTVLFYQWTAMLQREIQAIWQGWKPTKASEIRHVAPQERGFSVTAPKFWNSFPGETYTSAYVASFCQQVKTTSSPSLGGGAFPQWSLLPNQCFYASCSPSF